MNWKNTESRFGAAAQGFHWVIGLCVIGLLALGLFMTRLDPSPFMFKLYFWHKSIGITVLALALARVVWRLRNAPPAPLGTHKPWEKTLAKIIHLLLYGALFLMPMSGWAMSSANGYPVSVFGWFTLPNIVAESKAVGAVAGTVHEYAGYALILAVGLHAAGALKHHLIDRDDTLRRMLPAALFCKKSG